MNEMAWEMYLSLIRQGHNNMARITMRNMMARELNWCFPWLGWGPFRIGLRRWL